MTDTATTETTETTKVVMETGLAVTQFNNVALFASKDKSRPVLCGVLFEIGADETRMVATDSYALCVETIDVDRTGPVGSWIIPADAVTALAKLAAKERYQPVVEFTFGAFEVTIKVGSTSTTVPLVEGSFPAYRGLIPTDEPEATATIGMRADELARLGKLRDPEQPTNKEIGIRWEMHGSAKPAVARVGKSTMVLQMPVRF